MYKSFIKWLLIFGVGLFSQTGWAKTSMKAYLPTGLQMGMDVSTPAYYYWYKKTGPQYEFNTLIDFNRLLVQGDYGWGKIKRKGITTKIKDIQGHAIQSDCYNLGYYFRIGVDYNFIKNSVDDNAAFLGIRYAKSYFSDVLQSTFPEEYHQNYLKKPQQKSDKNSDHKTAEKIWDDHFVDSEQYNMQARWFELVAGFRVKVWKWIYLGGTARYQFNKKLTNRQGHIPFDIVGWGINSDDAFNVNIYLVLRLPLQKRIFPEKETKPTL